MQPFLEDVWFGAEPSEEGGHAEDEEGDIFLVVVGVLANAQEPDLLEELDLGVGEEGDVGDDLAESGKVGADQFLVVEEVDEGARFVELPRDSLIHLKLRYVKRPECPRIKEFYQLLEHQLQLIPTTQLHNCRCQIPYHLEHSCHLPCLTLRLLLRRTLIWNLLLDNIPQLPNNLVVQQRVPLRILEYPLDDLHIHRLQGLSCYLFELLIVVAHEF